MLHIASVPDSPPMFRWAAMRTIVVLAMCIAVVTSLYGCSSTKVVTKARDIKSDGETNIVLMSYDAAVIGADVNRSFSSVNTISFRCLNESTGKTAACFSIPITRGKRTLNGLTLNLFQADAAKPYQMKHGRYVIQSVNFQIQIGVETTESCHKNKKGILICTPVYTPIHTTGNADLPQPIAFSVSSGPGCFVGHFEIRMQLDDLLEFEHTIAVEAPAQRVSASVRAAVGDHVTRLCTAG